MTEYLRTHATLLRTYAVALSCAAGGAMLAVSITPQPAVASSNIRMDTWNCGGDDLCDAGEKPKCEDPNTDPAYTHCSTAMS